MPLISIDFQPRVLREILWENDYLEDIVRNGKDNIMLHSMRIGETDWLRTVYNFGGGVPQKWNFPNSDAGDVPNESHARTNRNQIHGYCTDTPQRKKLTCSHLITAMHRRHIMLPSYCAE